MAAVTSVRERDPPAPATTRVTLWVPAPLPLVGNVSDCRPSPGPGTPSSSEGPLPPSSRRVLSGGVCMILTPAREAQNVSHGELLPRLLEAAHHSKSPSGRVPSPWKTDGPQHASLLWGHNGEVGGDTVRDEPRSSPRGAVTALPFYRSSHPAFRASPLQHSVTSGVQLAKAVGALGQPVHPGSCSLGTAGP